MEEQFKISKPHILLNLEGIWCDVNVLSVPIDEDIGNIIFTNLPESLLQIGDLEQVLSAISHRGIERQ